MSSINLLILSLVMISAFFAIANYIAWRLFDRSSHALLWSVTFVYWFSLTLSFDELELAS